MKLIRCHIENFGKLHNLSVEFSDGANIICEENGWGKSTFAAFIRAMFYGLEGGRRKSIEENERKRYAPWQGGIFGGQLTFEVNGKQYIATRNFHEQDEFELRDVKTNLISDDYSSNLGEELFKVDRESFMRTVFIGQADCETVVTDDVNAKIGGWYYSESARDNTTVEYREKNYDLLPDVESTNQALCFLESANLVDDFGGRYANALPEWMKNDIGNWVKGLQNEDGFFYHPQWGKEASAVTIWKSFSFLRIRVWKR